MVTNMPSGLVSVIIPVSNRIHELKKSVVSALNQKYKNIEVLVVENNSVAPFKVDDVASEIADKRLRVYHLEPCNNANVARNYGVSKATGDYIAFLDSDDEWLPSHLSNALATIMRFDVDFVYGSFFVWNGFCEKFRNARKLENNEHPLEYLFGNNRAWAPTPTYVLTKNVFEKVKWDESLKRHQDFDFFVNVALNFKSAVNSEYDVKVNWIDGVERAYDAESMIYFYNKWKSQMNFHICFTFAWSKFKEAVKAKNLNAIFFFSRCMLCLPFEYILNTNNFRNY